MTKRKDETGKKQPRKRIAVPVTGSPIRLNVRPSSSPVSPVAKQPVVEALKQTPELSPLVASPGIGAAWLVIQGLIYFWSHYKIVRREKRW